MDWLPPRLHIRDVANNQRLKAEHGDAVMKTFLIKTVAALGLVSVLAVAGAASSSAEPIYHGYPLHDWNTTDGW
jgi:hypothetical protein